MVKARSAIAFGPKAAFTYPEPAGFIPERHSIGAAGPTATIESAPIRVDGAEHFSVSVYEYGTPVMTAGAPGTGYDISYASLIHDDGVDNSNGEFKNATWSDWVEIAADVQTNPYHEAFDPPVCKAIKIQLVNNSGSAVTATAPTPGSPTTGNGFQVRVHYWS